MFGLGSKKQQPCPEVHPVLACGACGHLFFERDMKHVEEIRTTLNGSPYAHDFRGYTETTTHRPYCRNDAPKYDRVIKLYQGQKLERTTYYKTVRAGEIQVNEKGDPAGYITEAEHLLKMAEAEKKWSERSIRLEADVARARIDGDEKAGAVALRAAEHIELLERKLRANGLSVPRRPRSK